MKQGWKYKTFTECINKIPKQKQVKSKDYKPIGRFPIVSQEKELISGYWDDESYVYRHSKPIIIFGDHTKEIKYIDFDFVVGADGTQILSPKDDIDTRFFYYYLLATPIRSLGYARHFKLLKEKSFYIPSLDEQRSIVARLDAAFAKIDALKANVERQLEEARALFNRALAKEMRPKEEWKEYVFGEIIKLQSGDNLPTKKIVAGEYPVYGGNGIAGYHNRFNKNGINIVVGRVGALCGNVHYVSTPFWLTDNGFEVIIDKAINVDKKFISIYLRYLDLGKYARQAAQPVISNASLKDIRMFIPPLPNQSQIVARLDALSANVRQLEEVQRKTLTECDALKQALLKETFE